MCIRDRLYDKLAGQLYEGHSLRLENLQKGVLLVLWGVMKKLVIADRAVKIINFVMDKPMDFSGTYVFFAAVVYALQLYADFSLSLIHILSFLSPGLAHV